MGFNDQGSGGRTGSTGRSFACMDPERQREIAGDAVRGTPGRITTRPVRSFQIDWMRAQPERTASGNEGGSSRRSR